MHKRFFKCDIRDPYMGNTIPILIQITATFEEGVRVEVTQGDGIKVEASPATKEDVHRMNT